MKKNKKNFGATLIELMVVISIISLLASIVLVSVVSAKKRAQRMAYVAYVKQVGDLFYNAYQMGLFDNLVNPYSCFGDYGPSNDCAPSVNTPLNVVDPVFLGRMQQIGTLPPGLRPPGSTSYSGLGGGINGTPMIFLEVTLGSSASDDSDGTAFCNLLPPVLGTSWSYIGGGAKMCITTRNL